MPVPCLYCLVEMFIDLLAYCLQFISYFWHSQAYYILYFLSVCFLFTFFIYYLCFCLFLVLLFICIWLFTFVIHDLCSPSRDFSFRYFVLFHELFIFSVLLFAPCYIPLAFISFVSILDLIVITFHSYTTVFVISNNNTGFFFNL